jgi:hypothetical protein
MIGDGDCGEIGGMKIGRGSRSTRRNPASHFVHHKSRMTRSSFEPGPPRWEASDYPLEAYVPYFENKQVWAYEVTMLHMYPPITF